MRSASFRPPHPQAGHSWTSLGRVFAQHREITFSTSSLQSPTTITATAPQRLTSAQTNAGGTPEWCKTLSDSLGSHRSTRAHAENCGNGRRTNHCPSTRTPRRQWLLPDCRMRGRMQASTADNSKTLRGRERGPQTNRRRVADGH